jgi:hypothetical protein
LSTPWPGLDSRERQRPQPVEGNSDGDDQNSSSTTIPLLSNYAFQFPT